MNRKYRKTVIAGNWKMNMLASEIKPFMEELKENLPKTRTCEMVLCTPAVMIPAMVKAGKDCKVAAGGQDVSKYEKGAYTGEVSASQLADIGAKYCIVGHSERRQYHGEDDMLINAKAKALLEKGILSKCEYGVKILGNGSLTKKLTVQASAFSASAKEKIEAAGGKVEEV